MGGGVRWDIWEGGFGVEIGAAFCPFEGEAGEGFEGASGVGGAVRGEEDFGVRSGEREGEGEEEIEVVFGLKFATFVAARESGGIEDDEIERLAVASESGEDGEDIIGIKAVAFFSVGEE